MVLETAALMVFAKGFGLGASLIIAIGAQNAFLLTHAVKGGHAGVIALICTLVDIALISLGVAGMGAFISENPAMLYWISLGGAAFLFCYGANAFRAFFRPASLRADDLTGPKSVRAVIVTTLAVSLLNPHVYLDTMVLLGSISATFAPESHWVFALGAMVASCVWFQGLAWFGKKLAPVFARPVAWQVLDGFICVVMWGLAASLVWSLIAR